MAYEKSSSIRLLLEYVAGGTRFFRNQFELRKSLRTSESVDQVINRDPLSKILLRCKQNWSTNRSLQRTDKSVR
jgi:hypothetical protein